MMGKCVEGWWVFKISEGKALQTSSKTTILELYLKKKYILGTDDYRLQYFFFMCPKLV